jgi:hypothetical protein
MKSWDEDMVPIITFPPPGIAVVHLHDLDAHLRAHACTDPTCLLGQGRLPLAPPCGHIQAIWTWQEEGRLWLVCARCDARLIVAVRGGVVAHALDEDGDAIEGSTTVCGHAPYGLVLYYEDGYIQVHCLECRASWSTWEVAAHVPDAPL